MRSPRWVHTEREGQHEMNWLRAKRQSVRVMSPSYSCESIDTHIYKTNNLTKKVCMIQVSMPSSCHWSCQVSWTVHSVNIYIYISIPSYIWKFRIALGISFKLGAFTQEEESLILLGKYIPFVKDDVCDAKEDTKRSKVLKKKREREGKSFQFKSHSIREQQQRNVSLVQFLLSPFLHLSILPFAEKREYSHILSLQFRCKMQSKHSFRRHLLLKNREEARATNLRE